MKGTLLVLAAVVFLARAAVEEDDLVLDVLKNVKRTVAEEHIRYEIEQIVEHLKNIEGYLEGDEELQQLVQRQASVTHSTDGSTTFGVNIPLGIGSLSGSFTLNKNNLPSGGSVGGSIGVGVQGTGSLGYDKQNGFGGSVGVGLGADGYGTDLHAGWSQHGGLSTGVGVHAGPVGTSIDHGTGGWSSNVGVSSGGMPSHSSSSGFLFGKREEE